MISLYSIEDRQAPFVDVFVSSATACGFKPRIIATKDVESPTFSKFRKIYRHFSINPEDFELACFRRYFEIARLVPKSERFIIADSDLLINLNALSIPKLFIEQPEALIGSIGYSDSVPEMDISPHFSFWNRTLVNRFIEYLIYIYESRVDHLVDIFNKRKNAGNKRAAISDMTLLHMFVHDTDVQFINSNQVVEGRLIDHNFSIAETANSIFKKEFGFKAFRRTNEHLSFITTNGETVRPVAIHLQGRAKIAASSLFNGNDLRARIFLGSVSLARLARSWLT